MSEARFSRQAAIMAQSSASTAAALMVQYSPDWDEAMFDELTTIIFNKVITLAGATSVLEVMEAEEGWYNKPEPQRGARRGGGGGGGGRTNYPSDPRDTTVDFGKHAGKSLGQLVEEDRSYVEWLADKARDSRMKEAAAAVLAG